MKQRIIKTILDDEMKWKSCQVFVRGLEKDPCLNMVYDRENVSLYEDVLMINKSNSIMMIDPEDVLMIDVYSYSVEELTKQVMKPVGGDE